MSIVSAKLRIFPKSQMEIAPEKCFSSIVFLLKVDDYLVISGVADQHHFFFHME